MRIALIADPLDYQSAGIYRYVSGMVKYWPEVFTEVDSHLFKAVQDKRNGWTVHGVPGNNLPLKRYTRKFHALPKAINLINSDIVIETAHFGPYRIKEGIKKFVFIHDITPITHPEDHPFLSSLIHNILMRKTVNSCDGILTNSNYTKTVISNRFQYPKDKIQVIYPGIDERFKFTTNDQILNRYALKPPYILHVGTIEPRKQIDLLIKRFKDWQSINETHKDFKLVIVGKRGWKSQKILRTIEANNDKIHWLDSVPNEDLPILYSMAALTMFIPKEEGFGFPPAESLLCGTPVVAADIPVLREVYASQISYVDPDDSQQVNLAMTKATGLRVDPIEMKENLSHLNWRTSLKGLKDYLESY